MSKEAWGRWGPSDEIGALNLADHVAVLRGLSTVREGRVVSLAQPLGPDTPAPSHRAGISRFMDRDGGDYAAGARRPGGFQFAEDTVLLPTHSGTHIDGLCHVWYDDELYNGFPASEIRSTTGAERCAVARLPPIVTRGVLLDVVKHAGRPLDPGDAISAEDLERVCVSEGVGVEAGDVVLVRTGWTDRLADLGADYFSGEPGIDVSAALWLAEKDVAVIGADNFAVEVIPFPESTAFPVHLRLVRDFGIPLIEGLVLAELASCGVTAFLFIAAPLPLSGATGSPLHPCAVI